MGYSWRQSTVTDGGCEGNVSCTWYSRTFYDAQMATENCVHPHAQLQQPWAHCEQWHGHHKAHWREHCAVLSTPRTVCRCIAQMCSFVTSLLKSRLCVFISIHGHRHAHLFLSFLFLVSTSSSSLSSTSSWILPWCLTRIPWKIPCVTPASGVWSAWTLSHPTQFEKLSQQDTLRKFCIEGFLNVVEIGQHLMTKNTAEFSQFTESAACLEHTLPRAEEATQPKRMDLRETPKLDPNWKFYNLLPAQ